MSAQLNNRRGAQRTISEQSMPPAQRAGSSRVSRFSMGENHTAARPVAGPAPPPLAAGSGHSDQKWPAPSSFSASIMKLSACRWYGRSCTLRPGGCTASERS